MASSGKSGTVWTVATAVAVAGVVGVALDNNGALEANENSPARFISKLIDSNDEDDTREASG